MEKTSCWVSGYTAKLKSVSAAGTTVGAAADGAAGGLAWATLGAPRPTSSSAATTDAERTDLVLMGTPRGESRDDDHVTVDGIEGNP
ncbi:hypothetical protein GCM10011512_00270 [Tersicoccus solisilvae]|uniref:Uncharacterized protein n=1 Tax=Tersicoccus solisilvae TaxID=1882339 RepID=A0ABQ1NLC4_9MICC|nr:hypothetical protein GCM10011512_00270 [Tersicoccus solisilvae]